MGDYNQAIIDVEVTTAEHARELASDVLAWLIAEQIIEDRLCDGCLGEGACYPPGPRFMQACGGKEDAALNGTYAEFSRPLTRGTKSSFFQPWGKITPSAQPQPSSGCRHQHPEQSGDCQPPPQDIILTDQY